MFEEERAWKTRTIVGTAAQLSGLTLAAGQVAQDENGLRKIGPGLYSALAYQPRRWSAAATNLLPTTNGDGVEKTVGSFVIPANTLANDGDRIILTLLFSYLNNTGSAQTPRWGANINSEANLFFSSATALTVASGAAAGNYAIDLALVRASSTSISIDAIFEQSGGLSYASTRRRSLGTLATLNAAIANTLNIKLLISTHVADPSLHQIAGIRGYSHLTG